MVVQMKMTLLLTAVAVPINTLFGVIAALNITRSEFPGKTIMVALLDLPFSISPVVTGVSSHILRRTGQLLTSVYAFMQWIRPGQLFRVLCRFETQ